MNCILYCDDSGQGVESSPKVNPLARAPLRPAIHSTVDRAFGIAISALLSIVLVSSQQHASPRRSARFSPVGRGRFRLILTVLAEHRLGLATKDLNRNDP